MIVRLCLLVALIAATGAEALDLPSNARLTAERVSEQDRYLAPIAPFDGVSIPTVEIEGQIRRQAWQVPGASLTPLQILAPLRQTLKDEGFTIRLDCAAEQCGGFDFRFGTDILPAPAMFVGLRNFLFLTMTKGPSTEPEAVTTLLVSTTRDAAYVQIIEVQKDGKFLDTTTKAEVAAPEAEITSTQRPSGDLLNQGYMVLDDVVFATGETALAEGNLSDLDALAEIMEANPNLRIALVGHTDSVGSLDGNINISRQRARSVRTRMIEGYGIAGTRIEAEGMGYLAPRASNLSETGRKANRRVEAIVLSNE